MANDISLAGLRTLVVEDEMLVSLLIEDVLSDEGCEIVGPYNRVDAAFEAARSQPLDMAVLDVNLAGVLVFPVAEILAERGIPFLFLSATGKTRCRPNTRTGEYAASRSGPRIWRQCSASFGARRLAVPVRCAFGERFAARRCLLGFQAIHSFNVKSVKFNRCSVVLICRSVILIS